MLAKLFEIRDRATFIPIMAVKMESDDPLAQYLLRRAGYSSPVDQVLMVQIAGGDGKASCDPYHFYSRSYRVAHDHIIKNFDTLNDGDVIDVEFILGETQTKKVSEREIGD